MGKGRRLCVWAQPTACGVCRCATGLDGRGGCCTIGHHGGPCVYIKYNLIHQSAGAQARQTATSGIIITTREMLDVHIFPGRILSRPHTLFCYMYVRSELQSPSYS